MEQQKARAAPHHHPCAEPRGSAGAGTEPTTPWPDQHKASLQEDSAAEPRPLQRCNSGKSVLPYKNTTALWVLRTTAVQRCCRPPRCTGQLRAPAPSQQVSHIWGVGSPKAGSGDSGEQSAWNLGMTPGASSFLLSHRIVPPLPNTPNHPQFAF